MMTHDIFYILTAILVLTVFTVIVYINTKPPTKDVVDYYAKPINIPKEPINISVDPVIDNSPYEIIENVGTCAKRPDLVNPTQYGGLNPKSNSKLTVTDFINTYGTGENYNCYDTADVTSRRYCDILYRENIEYFSDRWSALGECELDVKEQVQKLFPKAPVRKY